MAEPSSKLARFSRRAMMLRLLTVAAALSPLATFANERVEAARVLIEKLIGSAAVEDSGIILTTPAIAENGNTVPISVEVKSPFTADNYVKAVHIIAEENPTPEVVTFRYGAMSGRARNSTRIRLARTGRVIAIAELSDGRVLRTANEVKVTIGGCGG